MAYRATLVILAAALALPGCATGIVDSADQANTLRLMSGSVASATAEVPADEVAEPTAQPADGKIRVTVEGPPAADAAPPADETAPADETNADDPPPLGDDGSPLPDEVSPADEVPPADEAPHAADNFQFNEPENETVVTDEPISDAPITDEPISDETINDEPITDEPIRDEPADTYSAPAAAGDATVETIVEPLAPENAVPIFTQDREEVIAPRPLPASPFRLGGDEAEVDRFRRQVTDVPIDIRPTEGDMPPDFAAARRAAEPTIDETWQIGGRGDEGAIWPGDAPPDVFCSYSPWTFCYRPLYFEDIPLERYGCNVGYLQTGLSGVKFFGSILALPYKMTVRPPRSCQCSNGFSRCGDCPLPGYGRREFRLDASMIEAAAVAGVVYILP